MSSVTFPTYSSPKLPSVFNEGGSSTTNKIISFIVSFFASLLSFLFLPLEAALLATSGIFTFLPSLIESKFSSTTPQPSPVPRQPAALRVAVGQGHIQMSSSSMRSASVTQARVVVGSGHNSGTTRARAMPGQGHGRK